MFKGLASLSLFLRIGQFDPNGGKVVLIGFVVWFLFQGSGEMAFLAGFIALGAGQPSGNDMIGSALAIFLRHALERFAGDVELAETQRSGGEIQLACALARTQARDLGAPADGLGAILFLGGFSQNFAGG